MKHVALVTYKASPNLTASDELLVKPLENEGIQVIAVPWDDPTVDWNKFDAIVLRSCWNYHVNYDKFILWLTHLKHIQANVFNPVNLMLWNSKKTYLQDLQKSGIPIIPTIYHQKNIQTIHSYTGWNDIIAKPLIGIRSNGVYRFKNPNSPWTQIRFKWLTKKTDYLIQPFMTEFQTDGEYSFIFIGRIFSHAVRKTQHISLVKPSQIHIRQARQALKAVGNDTLYARVDGIFRNNTFILLELELIEPILYFDLYPPAAISFAKALKKRLQ
jgi:hypothetical protein